MIDLGISWAALEAEAIRRSLSAFVRAVWDVVEPSTPLEWGWHLDAICAHLEAVTRGEVRDLVICVPPGHMKSLLVSVFWPAWEWLTFPGRRWLFSSHSESLVLRDSDRCRHVIESPVYKALVAELAASPSAQTWGLSRGQNAKSKFENTARGYRQCVTVNGAVTGTRADVLVVDDPVDVKDVVFGEPSRVAERMAAVLDWYDKVLYTRMADHRSGRRVVIMQRVHPEDLAGVLAGREGWTVLCLPSEYDPAHPMVWAGDPRTTPGELLFEARFPAEVIAELKTTLGPHDYGAQHDQRPVPRAGGLFQRDWFGAGRRYSSTPAQIASTCDEVAIFVDCAFKGASTSDPVCLHVWGRKGPHRYLLDRVHGQMGIAATKQALRDLARRWPAAALKIVEDKANGSAVVEELGREMSGLIGWSPDKYGDKWARARLASGPAEAGNIWLPASASWAGEVIEQWCGFPGLPHDEDVDCLSMMWIRWAGVEHQRAVAQPLPPPSMFIPREW